jgi:hypothetical protein
MMRRHAAVTDQTLRAAAEAVSGTNPFPLGNAVATAGGNRGVNETELPMRSSGPSI